MILRAILLIFAAASVVRAEVRIHDPVVSVLAKPYGIEKLIKLKSLDAVDCGPSDEHRLRFTLQNSGTKQVMLKDPVFRLELVLPDGSWASLGELRGARITFPVTGKSRSVNRTYVAELTTKLTCADLTGYLNQAARTKSPIRMIGKATMTVGEEGDKQFEKKNLTLELSGRTTLARAFKTRQHSSKRALPAIGLQ